MRRVQARLAIACGFAIVTAAFTGVALAGNGNDNAPGQEKKDAAAATQASPAQPAAQPQQQVQAAKTPPGQAKKEASVPQPSSPAKSSPGQAKHAAATSSSSSSSTQAGVKPSSSTSKWTHCTTGGTAGAATCTATMGTPNPTGKPDVSKQYGNGKTAAQIAVSRGAPQDTLITGPGNSQPHKVSACGKPNNKSGGVDVHAIKSYAPDACQPKAQTVQPAQQTVTPVCGQSVATVEGGVLHQKGNGRFVLIHPNAHAMGKHRGDVVVPAQQVLVPNGQTCGSAAAPVQTPACVPTTTTQQVQQQVVAGVWHKTGNGKFVLIHPNAHSAHMTGKHTEDVPNVVTVTRTIEVTAGAQTCGTSSPSVVAPTPSSVQQQAPTVQVVTATVTPASPSTPTTANASPATQATSAPAGGVLGAQATIAKPKAAKHGVLGTVTRVAGTTLPFTGFPLWAAALVAAGLLAGGVALRRRGAVDRL